MTYLDKNPPVKDWSSDLSEFTRRCFQRRHLQKRYWCFWIVGALIPFTVLRIMYLCNMSSMKGPSSDLDLAAGMTESYVSQKSRRIDEAAWTTFVERISEEKNQMKRFFEGNKWKQESKPEYSLEMKDEESVSLPVKKSDNIDSVALLNGENQDVKQEKKDKKLEEKREAVKQEEEDEKSEEKHQDGKQEMEDEKLEEKQSGEHPNAARSTAGERHIQEGKDNREETTNTQEKKLIMNNESEAKGPVEQKQAEPDKGFDERGDTEVGEDKEDQQEAEHSEAVSQKEAETRKEGPQVTDVEAKEDRRDEKELKDAGGVENVMAEEQIQAPEKENMDNREEKTNNQEKKLITNNESEAKGPVEQKQAEPEKEFDERGDTEVGVDKEDQQEAEHSEAVSQKEAETREEGPQVTDVEAKEDRQDEKELKDAGGVENVMAEEQIQAPEKENMDEKHEDGISVTDDVMDSTQRIQTEEANPTGKCDIFEGDWVWDPEGPLYTNSTCFYIQGTQNCMSNGRPDTDYLHWKWKPRDCDLPRFDAKAFLESFKGKAIGFVGDSLARNQMQSLLCMLSQIEVPRVVYRSDDDTSVRWLYEQHQVTLAVVWSPYLLKESREGIMGFEKGQSVLYLDVLDTAWTSVMQDFDIMVLSIGQWYFKGSIYVAQDDVVGCHYCPGFNFTEIGFFEPYRGAVRQVLEKVASEFKGIAIMSTFAISHFEDGPYSNGGQCRRQHPLGKEEGANFPGMHYDMHDIILSEFNNIAYDKSKLNENVNLEFLDVTKVSLTRADGHPGAYRKANPYLGRNPDEWVPNDCLHWCLPGPVDTWNQLLVKIVNDIFTSSQNNSILSESG